MVTPPPLPMPAPAHGPPLAPEQFAQLRVASVAMRKVRRAVLVANIDGWSVGVFGGLTMLVGLTDVASLLLGALMIGVSVVELRAARALTRLDISAPKTLALNQIALGTSLLIYAIVQLVAVLRGEGEYAAIIAQEPALREMLGGIDELTRLIMISVYATVMAVAVFGQGGLAIYYYTRAEHVRHYLAQTPAWILEMQRTGVQV